MKITISKAQWEKAGRDAGWIKTSKQSGLVPPQLTPCFSCKLLPKKIYDASGHSFWCPKCGAHSTPANTEDEALGAWNSTNSTLANRAVYGRPPLNEP